MKNIAIFASGSGECASRVVALFNGGDSIRVKTVVTDRENAEVIETMRPLGVEVEFVAREEWHSSPERVLSLLREGGVSLIVLDDFRGTLPPEIEEEYAGRVLSVTSADDAPRLIAEALGEKGEEPAPPAPEEPRKSVDEEWAETLKINYDPSRLRPTPPPLPGRRPDVPYAPPAGPGFAQPYQDRNRFAGTNMSGGVNIPGGGDMRPFGANMDNREPMPPNYMVWSVLATIFCCFIPGIVAIVFSSQVSSRYFLGDMEGARRASRNAQRWIIASVVVGVVTATLYLPVMLMG